MEKSINTDMNNYLCPICLNLLIEPVKIECNHMFCYTCLDELMDNSNKEIDFKCPMCRENLKKNFNLKIDKTLENQIKNLFAKEYELRSKMLMEYKKSMENIIKIKILYGNSHELVESPKKSNSHPENCNKHRWGAFVKVANEESQKYIRKVVFGLHPTFGATQLEVKTAPFEIKRIGWGTFDIPIKIYFHYDFKIKEPIELDHHLSFNGEGETKVYIFKLDKNTLKK